MGYQTEFTGHVEVTPRLNASEVAYLKRFADTRRMKRTRGPYFVGGAGFAGQANEADVLDYNNPDASQPELWCKWEPSDDGATIAWNGVEKFYEAEEWMRYLVNHFLKPGAVASTVEDMQFAEFTFDHVVNGVIDAEGEEQGDLWRVVVSDNVVSRVDASVVWPGADGCSQGRGE